MNNRNKDKDENKKENINSGVRLVDIIPEMKESYLDYAMSVIVSRALPDVRDGLKPVHRRILYTMHEMGLTSSAKFRKSAAISGNVVANYHPHGDVAVYDALVKMAQTFSTRYPLILGQGNFGSPDGDAAAAMRYTEAKMSKVTEEILRDIEKETVLWRPNYDNTRKEPLVLPSVVPNLLLNGTLGIAVGMATKIPPHNLNEVIDALIFLLSNKSATTEDLLQFVQGPDFPTGGMIFGKNDIQHAYATGKGGVCVRGEATVEEEEKGGPKIVITSLPYQVNKAEFIIKVANLVHEKRIEGIRDIRDESTTDVRIVIELKGGAHPQKIINSLYKRTDLELMFHFNMLALVDGIPKVLSLKSILEEFLVHRKDVIKKRTTYELRKAEEREHILVGLKKALDHIDEIIKTIKKSKDTKEAHFALMKSFRLSDKQSTAILEMKLQRLAGLERKKVNDELIEKRILIKDLKEILGSATRVSKIIRNEFETLKEKFGDERKTKVVKGNAKIISPEDLIPDTESVLVLSQGGYVKRTDPKEYKRQKRGGVGVSDLATKEEDFVKILQTANTHNDLLFFTDRGKCFQMKMYDIPEGKRATRGKSLMNFLSISSEERVTSVLSVPQSSKGKKHSIAMITKRGCIKKIDATSLSDVRRSGIIAVKLGKDDELLSALLIESGEDIILVTKNGQSIRFSEKDIRTMGRGASGVRAMKLGKLDIVVGADVIGAKDSAEQSLLVMSENGFGKRTKLSEYKRQKRSGTGIKTAKTTDKTGKLISGRVVGILEKEVVAISMHGTVIRVDIGDIPVLGRQTQGVRIMKLRAKDAVAQVTFL